MWPFIKKEIKLRTDEIVFNHLLNLISEIGYEVTYSYNCCEGYECYLFGIKLNNEIFNCKINKMQFNKDKNKYEFRHLNYFTKEWLIKSISNEVERIEEEKKIKKFKEQISTPKGLIKFLADNIGEIEHHVQLNKMRNGK